MLWLMLVLGAAGAALLFGAPWLAQRWAPGRADPVALARLLQLAGALLLLLALLLRPPDSPTTAFPPPRE